MEIGWSGSSSHALPKELLREQSRCITLQSAEFPVQEGRRSG